MMRWERLQFARVIARKFTRLRELSGPCQHPLHKGEKTKLKKSKKVIKLPTFQTEYIRRPGLLYLLHPVSIPVHACFYKWPNVNYRSLYEMNNAWYEIEKYYVEVMYCQTYAGFFVSFSWQSYLQRLLWSKDTWTSINSRKCSWELPRGNVNKLPSHKNFVLLH